MNDCIGDSLAIAFHGFAGLLLVELNTYFTAIVSGFGMTKGAMSGGGQMNSGGLSAKKRHRGDLSRL
jgi:hypothetical protein